MLRRLENPFAEAHLDENVHGSTAEAQRWKTCQQSSRRTCARSVEASRPKLPYLQSNLYTYLFNGSIVGTTGFVHLFKEMPDWIKICDDTLGLALGPGHGNSCMALI